MVRTSRPRQCLPGPLRRGGTTLHARAWQGKAQSYQCCRHRWTPRQASRQSLPLRLQRARQHAPGWGLRRASLCRRLAQSCPHLLEETAACERATPHPTRGRQSPLHVRHGCLQPAWTATQNQQQTSRSRRWSPQRRLRARPSVAAPARRAPAQDSRLSLVTAWGCRQRGWMQSAGTRPRHWHAHSPPAPRRCCRSPALSAQSVVPICTAGPSLQAA